MTRLNKFVVFSLVLVLLFKESCTQLETGNICTLESSGSSGVCKLLSDCDKIKNDILIQHRLPQVCGFLGTQPIVCCPKDTPKTRSPGDISRKKCMEYKSALYASQQTPISNECGHYIITRALGSQAIQLSKSGHLALIGFEAKPNETEWLCGGGLISEQYILTSAHCGINSDRGSAKYARIGNLGQNDSSHTQEVRIVKVMTHPNYHPPSLYNDIALLKLEKPLSLNSYVRLACLYTQENVKGSWALLSAVLFDIERRKEKVQQDYMDIVDLDHCNSSHKGSFSSLFTQGISKESQICTRPSSTYLCKRIVGGLLHIYRSPDEDFTCTTDIIGVTSFGQGCDTGVYTKVFHYLKWIEDVVWPENG